MMRYIPDWQQFWEIVRFYQAAAINTAFGVGAYVLLVWLGMDKYVAQATSHVMGMAFNYLTYSRHAFRGSAPAKLRFLMAYGVHYVISLAALAVIAQFVGNPYVAGIAAAFVASLINYFILRKFVFRARAT